MLPVAAFGISLSGHWELPFLLPCLKNILFDGGIPAIMPGTLTAPHPPPENVEDVPRPDVIKMGSTRVLLNGVIPCPTMGCVALHIGGTPTVIATGISHILIGF